MVIDVRPARGGFLRPFGTAFFIRDYLAGEGPKYGVEAIDPGRGAPQVDIHAAYKNALHRAMAEDAAVRREEQAAREEGRRLDPDQIERLTAYYLERVPYKLTRMRSHSFRTYFHHLKRLGWVEETGETEPSAFQDAYPPASPRVFYRLTPAGRQATIPDLSDPIKTLYQYPSEQRSAKERKYVRRPAPRGYARRRARRLAQPVPAATAEPTPAPRRPRRPPPARASEYQLPRRATGLGVTRLIAHVRSISGLSGELLEAEMGRIKAPFKAWVDAAQRAYNEESGKEQPSERRLASLAARLDALKAAAVAIAARDPYGVVLALEQYP